MTKEFNRKDWNRKMSKAIKEHPELQEMSGHIELFVDKGDVKKVKIKDKTV